MNHQTKKQETWTDEAGNQIPYSNITKKEKVIEEVAFKIASDALRVNKQLIQFKNKIRKLVDAAVDSIIQNYSGKKTVFKGNYTLYNFDRSIKICVKVSQPIKFDEVTIEQARQLLREFLEDGLSAKNMFIKQMVLDAFETRRGQMDTKRVMGLQRYADRIDDKRYRKAMELITQSIRRPESATYYQVWIKDEKGNFKSVELDLARISS